MLTLSRPKQLVSVLGTLLIGCTIACGNGASSRSSNADDVRGTWKVTGTEEANGLSKDQSIMVGLMQVVDPDTGDRRHLFTNDAYIVNDASGKQVHRWPYKVEGDLMVIGSDTTTIKWTDPNSFTLIADSVSVHYQRIANTDR